MSLLQNKKYFVGKTVCFFVNFDLVTNGKYSLCTLTNWHEYY